MKKVTIIILNWNGKEDTLECLKSVRQLSAINCQLSTIVVDNGSTDGLVNEIKNEKLKMKNDNVKLKIIENKKNLGFAEGNNVGIRYALKEGADYVMLLNNDTLVEKNMVKELLWVMEKDKTIAIAGPKIYFAPGFEYHANRYKEEERGKVIWYAGGIIDWQNVYASHRGVDEVDHGQYNKEEETDFVTGCAMMVKREVFEKIGFLDPKYFLYFEDNDFCQRAKRAGFKIFYVPKAIIYHKNAASSEKPGSAIQQYYQTRNRFLFGFKYASLRAKLALLRENLKFLLKDGIRRKATIDFCLGRFGGKVGYS
ncbi:glycosyltransferase family 2 protein [Candidatus Gottesmanbacteria bacterium]|nr:glycosyltransferase family 2 protein [Candidatus Gottesmanbacteria bacterium]